MLDDIIKKIPKFLLALVCVVGAIAYIMINDPPHKFCDTQVDHFRSVQVGIIFKNPANRVQPRPQLEKLFLSCKETVSPGACYEYFAMLNRLIRDFNLLSQECTETELINIEEVRAHLLNGLMLMTQLAWREEVLEGKVSKMNWLKAPDMSLFCKLKTKISQLYGSATLKSFEQTILKSLPAKDSVDLATIRKNSILSENCTKYP